MLISNITLSSTDADEHILAMLNKYESLRTYEDEGVSSTKFIKSDGGNNYTDELIFTTKYVENELLQFEWARQPSEIEKKIGGALAQPKVYKVWHDKAGAFSKYRTDKKEKYANLAKALSGATGISTGLAWMTPRYLSPNISCKPNLGAKSSEVLKSDANTVIIKLTHNTGSISKLFIDKKSYLLKKYENIQDLGNGTVTHQNAVFNIINAK